MTRQYLRACKLTVGGVTVVEANGDDDQLRVTFRVVHAEASSRPQSAVITIYNLAPSTEKKLMKERVKVELSAGYRDGYGLIFAGEVIQATSGRENPTDTRLVLVVRGSDTALNYGVVNKTLAAGHTWQDRFDAVAAALSPYGVTVGYKPNFGGKKFPNPLVMSGMAKDYMRAFGLGTAAAWSVQDGKLQVVKNSGFKPGDAIVLNSTSGLIGRPQQTLDGVVARCLLNPRIRTGTRVKIDQSSIDRQLFSPAYGAEVQNAMIPEVTADGIYKVLYVDEIGDTRGTEWYTEFTCLAASGNIIPLSIGQRGIVDPDVIEQEKQGAR